MVSELFFAKFLEILTTGSLEIGKFLQKQSVPNFRATPHALQLTGLDEDKSKNCWVLFVVTFSNIPLCSATLNSLVTGTHCPVGHRYALGKIALFMSTMGAFRFDQNFRKFRFKIEWNRDFPEIRLENFGSPLEVVLFSGNLEIPEIFCSIWHTIQARI